MNFVWENTVFSLVSFIILYLLLNKFAFGPLFGMMEKRRQMIKEQIHSAETDRVQASKMLDEQKQALESARREAYDIIEQAQKMSEKQAKEMTRLAEQEARQIKKEAIEDIEVEKNKAIVALRSQVSAMSVMIASKIIEKQVDEKTQKELVEQYLDKVGGKV